MGEVIPVSIDSSRQGHGIEVSTISCVWTSITSSNIGQSKIEFVVTRRMDELIVELELLLEELLVSDFLPPDASSFKPELI